jgi:signal transduction histidine kinase/CheY-like chemotaxis protein
LKGLQQEWVDAGTERTVSFANLNPGKYVFQVIASNANGVWNNEGATIEIVIMPAFWQTWWFIILGITTVVGSVYMIFKVRMRAYEKQQAEIEKQVKERTDETFQQKEDLLTQSEYLESINGKLLEKQQEILKQREEADKARAEADAANRAKSVFLATMSHEIRTPMNGVIGMASLLSETTLTQEQREYTDTIKSSGESLLRVINDILDFSKIESGKMELEQASFNLRTCIEEVLDLFAGKAAHLNLKLMYQIDADVPENIIGDCVRLRQIFINLVGNAVKFTTQGEVFVGVQLVKQQDRHFELKIDVTDTGIGIPEDKMERLFKAFSQLDSSTTRKYGGTGLGLIICEKLITLMGGTIKVNSVFGKGTTFSFTIQTISDSILEDTTEANMEAFADKHVLIAIANNKQSSLLHAQLLQWKLTPLVVNNVSDAFTLVDMHAYDLVITDMLPVTNDIDYLQFLRTQYPTLPVILLTNFGDERAKVYQSQLVIVIHNPVKQSMLFKSIEGALKGNHNQGEIPVTSPQKLSNAFAQAFPLQILIAEDNPVNQKLAEKVMLKLGYKPHIASNGQLAVDALQAVHYNIIFMDVQMPEVDGLEATRIIRSQSNYQPVIIAMTANAMQGDKEICLQAGMNDYISKPVKLEELVAIIEKWASHVNNVHNEKPI